MSLSITNTIEESQFELDIPNRCIPLGSTENDEQMEPAAAMGALQEMLWRDRKEPYYAVHPTTSRTNPLTKQRALGAIRSGNGFFAPVPRVRLGNKKADCAEAFNVLWCDIDLADDTALDDAVIEVADRLEAIPELYPSALVYSGSRGMHLYWKLAADIPIEQIEAHNKRLAAWLDGDSVCDRTHLMRNPGTINEKSGRLCEVIEISGFVLQESDLQLLVALVPPVSEPEPSSAPASPASVPGDGEWVIAAQRLDADWGEVTESLNPAKLSPDMREYALAQPTHDEFLKAKYRGKYPSRSEFEQAIVLHLVGKQFGASDRQVIQFADHFLQKHRDEQTAKRSNHYIQRTIDKAREYLYEKNHLISSPLGGWPKKREANYRHTGTEDRNLAIKLAAGQPSADWVATFTERSGHSKATAYRIRSELITSGKLNLDSAGRLHVAFSGVTGPNGI